ncbi:MAG: hypothetical protein IPJ41_17230 [Phycisphaerales bacterium]|nr:hypothetical protein [Phycisphaerales bacterium]
MPGAIMSPPTLACILLTAAARGQVETAVPAPPPAPSPAAATPDEPLETLYEHRELRGFGIRIRREFVARDPDLLARVLTRLDADLEEINHLLPPPALDALRGTTIWVELQGARVEGMSGRGLCCHWSADWLASVGLPREKAGGVEIVNPHDYLDWRTTQPYMLLHELSHAYHRLIGPDLPEILDAYHHAIDSGLYEHVERNSVPAGETVRAYAATNHHEYFAELSEAYFALNDFEPYTRTQLEALDPQGLEMVAGLWNLAPEEIAARVAAADATRD